MAQRLAPDPGAWAAPGQVLCGRYRLDEPVGRGGMGEVWAAHDIRLDRRVAVKLLRPELGADPAVRLRFESEARAAARLSHPNAVSVLDAGEHDGRALMVMELLPGTSLADDLRAGPLEPEAVRSMAIQVLGALAAAHRRGLVHRDVKPANILHSGAGHWKVADFGIAKTLSEAGDLTSTGMLLGTPAYLAPERVDGLPATAASDLFSLGVVMFEALTGRKPFVADTPLAQLEAMRSQVAPPVRALRPEVPVGLAAVVERAMEKDPARRLRSAETMAAALEGPLVVDATAPAAVAGGGPATSVLPLAPDAPVADRAAPGRRRRVRTWAAAVLSLLALGAVAALSGHHGGTSSTPPAPATTVASTASTVATSTTVTTAPAPPAHAHGHGAKTPPPPGDG